MKTKFTEALESSVTEKKKTADALREKIATLDEKIGKLEKASNFDKLPAAEREAVSLRAELDRAEAAVHEAEAPLPRSRFLDSRAARIAEFEDVDPRAVAARLAANAAVVTAVRALSEACVLGKAAGELAGELGGTPAGYTVHPDAIDGIDASFFERLSYGSEITRMNDVRFPIVRTLIALPAPGRGRRSGGLVSSEETAAALEADRELSTRK